MKDINGKDITVGARVALGTRQGNSGGLIMGTVQSFEAHHWHGQLALIKTDGKRNTTRPGKELAVVMP